MSLSFVTPETKSILGLLEMVFGEGVEVSESEPSDPADKHVATFISDDDELVAVCMCDLPFVAYSGSALSMIPAHNAQKMLDDGDITDTVAANFYEVMNICSKLFMNDSSSHLRLDKTLTPDGAQSVLTELSNPSSSCGFELDIPRYGKGKMEFAIK